LADAVVRVAGCGDTSTLARTAVTDAFGSFLLDGLPKLPCMLEVEHPDHVPIELEATPGGARLAIQMRRGLRLKAELHDLHTGEPVRGARAVLAGGDRRARAQSNTQGRFEISGINEGHYELFLTHPGYAPSLAEAVVRGDDAITDLGVIELAPAGSVLGDVVDGFGSVVSGATVAAISLGKREAPPAVRSARDGSFRLGGLPPGTHVLQARSADGQRSETAEVRARSGETHGGVVLRFEGRVEPGTEVSAAGAAAAPAVAEGTDPASGKPLEGIAVELGYAAGAVRIERVIGPGAQGAGLRAGDALESIDGEAVLAVSQGRALLRGSVGSKARLLLTRGKKLVAVSASRERYLP
jgi:hypothetical protein